MGRGKMRVQSADRSLDDLVKQRRAEIAREAHWYVLEAHEGKDFAVCCRLAAAGFDVFRPVDRVTVTRRVRVGGVLKQQKVARSIPRFGRFLFLRTKMSVWVRAAIEQNAEVAGFVKAAGTEELAVMPDDLMGFYQQDRAIKPVEEGKFGNGDRVRIAEGPWTGVIGVLKLCGRRGGRIEAREATSISTLFVPLGDLELVEKAVAGPRGDRKSRRAGLGPSRHVSVAG